jgi:hypothetical protein
MKLLQSERLLFQIDTGKGHLVLTTHRVCHSSELEFTSIMLEDVCSVAVTRTAHRWILAAVGGCIAIACLLIWTVVWGDSPIPEDVYRRSASLLLFVSSILMIVFTITRFSKIQVASPAASIQFRVRNSIRKDVRQFVREMESAKNARYLESERKPVPESNPEAASKPEPAPSAEPLPPNVASLPDRLRRRG